MGNADDSASRHQTSDDHDHEVIKTNINLSVKEITY